MDGKPQHEAILHVGQTPALLVGLGLPDLPLVVTGKTIDKVFFDHGITKGVIERVHSLVSTPKTVYKAAPPHHAGSVVVTFEVHRGNPIIIPIRASKRFGREFIANEVTSIYAKEGVSYEQWWTSAGLLIWTK